MKRITITLALLAIGNIVAYCQAQNIDIVSYDIKVNYETTCTLKINAILKVKNIAKVSDFYLLLSPTAQINFIRSKKDVGLKYEWAGKDTLKISLPSQISKLKEFPIAINYILPVDTAKYVLLCVRSEDRWYPLIVDDLAKYRLGITLPSSYSAFSTYAAQKSKSSQEIYNYLFKGDLEFKTIPLVIVRSDSLQRISKLIDNKIIDFYFYSTDKEIIDSITCNVCSSYEYYNKYFGANVYQKLTIIEMPDMEFIQSLPGIVILGDFFTKYYKKGFDGWESHETAHQWIGSGIYIRRHTTCRSFLEESFSEYLKLMYLRNKNGENYFIEQLDFYASKYDSLANKEKDVPISSIFTPYRETGTIIYKKGPVVYNEIEKALGRDKFNLFLKKLYRKYSNRYFSYDDLIHEISKQGKTDLLIEKLDKWINEKGPIDNLRK